MNSLYNNLGPRRSRGGGDIFISIGIIISLIVIFYMVYKLIQGNKSDDDDKNNEDDTTLIPEIGPPVMGMVLKPDEDKTNAGSEKYEIGNGKIETYRIENYDDGVDDNAYHIRPLIDDYPDYWKNRYGHFNHHLGSYLVKSDDCNTIDDTTKLMVSLVPVSDGFKMQVYSGNFNNELGTGDDKKNNKSYLGLCSTNDNKIVGNKSYDDALVFEMGDPPYFLYGNASEFERKGTHGPSVPATLPDDPGDKEYTNESGERFDSKFVGFKSFQAKNQDKNGLWLVIKHGYLELASYVRGGLGKEVSRSMIMALYKKTDPYITLSKNVIFSVDWNNTIGFNTVNSIKFTHYIKSFEQGSEYVAVKTKVVQRPTTLGDDDISNYFRNGSSGNRFTLDGTKGDFINDDGEEYNVLGYNRIGISIQYGSRNQVNDAYGINDFNDDETSSAKVSQDDLAMTLDLVKEKIYTFQPEVEVGANESAGVVGKYTKIVYHVFPYVNSGFGNHLSSYLGTCNGTNNSTNNMVSLNVIGESKDTFKIQVFPGDFDTEITNSDGNYLGLCSSTDKSIVSGGISKANALSFIMVNPPTDITLPTDTPAKTDKIFLDYKTFKVIDGTEDKFLVISDGLLKLKKWQDLTVDELPTMIMAFYKKDAKGCYAISPENQSEELRRYINSNCHEIIRTDPPVHQIFNSEALCENTGGDKVYGSNHWVYRNIWHPKGYQASRENLCEWRNPTMYDL